MASVAEVALCLEAPIQITDHPRLGGLDELNWLVAESDRASGASGFAVGSGLFSKSHISTNVER